MSINYSVILAYAVGIIVLFIVGRVLLVPMKVVLKLVYNALLGAIVLIVVNFLGGYIGFHLALNVITAFVVGILGVPGFILLVVLKFLFQIP